MKDNLLPNYCKNIFLSVGILALIIKIVSISFPELINLTNPVYNWVVKDIILASFLLSIFSKEKEETEFIKKIKSEKLKNSIVFGVIVLIIDSIQEIIFHPEEIDMKSSFHIMLTILIFYLVTFNLRKYNHEKATNQPS